MAVRTNWRRLRRLSIISLSCLGVFSSTGPAFAHPEAEITDSQVKLAAQRIEQLAQQQIDKQAAVGLAMAIVHKDKVIFAKGFGKREVGKDALVDADTAFQLASVSKPLAATVVAKLVGEGKITWDSKINDLDPAFEMYVPWVTREITIRDLFAHRSGLPDHAGDLLEDMGYERAEVLHRLRYQRPDSSFRSSYAYTNFGLTEASVAAAKPYGLTWEDASAQLLYKPLGMNSTSSRYADFMARTNKALGHVLVDGRWVQKYHRDPDAESPAGGASSSVMDMAQWMRLRLSKGKFDGKQIVAEEALAETDHPQILTSFSPLNGLPGFYGLGMNVNYDEHGRLHLGHSGAFALGASTAVGMVPSESLGIVILTNSYPMGVPEGLGATFMDLVLEGKETRDWLAFFRKIFADPATLGLAKGFDYAKRPVSQAPALANNAYIGTYSNDLYGNISIIEHGGGLAVLQGPNKTLFPLTHYERDTFTYETAGENAVGRSGVTFKITADGRSSDVTIENLNEFNQGVFHRIKR
jgi:CubicO group peptidase (beta-lactamase class C family)